MADFTLAPGEAVYWPVSLGEYHRRRDLLGHSMLEDFRESPRQFKAWTPRPWTDALRVGTALHDVLEGGPDALKAWRTVDVLSRADQCSGERVLREKEAIGVLRCWRSLLASEATGPFLAAAGQIRERPIVWKDAETGVLCKCCPDIWIPGEIRVVCNLKTAADVRPLKFRYQIEDLGYHRAAAWYLDGEAALHGDGPCEHVFLAVSKATYETAAYTLTAADLDKARAQNRRALRRYAECQSTGNWTARFERQVTELSLAGHAFNEDDYDLC